jgi:aminoglycoside phosphotransferase (APT) family kinase protein
LPTLAPRLPVAIPAVVASGIPDCGYPYPWSVRRWIEGERVDAVRLEDPVGFALAVANFVNVLNGIAPGEGPAAGAHSFYRGADPVCYDAETRESLSALAGRIDTERARAMWAAGLAATWTGRPAWFHGDIAPGNLLVRDGALAAVIDFGTSGVGDPACDLVIAWTYFRGAARGAFVDAVARDAAMWARARAWGLWKALIVLRAALDTGDAAAEAESRATLAALFDGD